MSGKGKVSRLETEIEKCRIQGLWDKAADLAKKLTVNNTGVDAYVHFIIGECGLEQYVKENPPSEQNTSKAKDSLGEAEQHLKLVSNENGKLSNEASLLLAKLYYCKGEYHSSLALFDRVSLDSLPTQMTTPRLLHIYAEAYAIKGYCIEKISPSNTSKYKAEKREEQIISCFERAGDLALLYLQEKEKSLSSQTVGAGPIEELQENIGPILETAIQQSPIYYIKHGDLEKGIGRFRELLRAVESRFSQGLRLTLARQLAEVLLRGVCEKTYKPPSIKGDIVNPSPRKYTGDGLFVPDNETEEALLLLLIAEVIATREAVLNRSAEHKQAQNITFQNATAVYNLLAIALVKRAQFDRLSESFERAMKFSFKEFHIWYQFANSLICARKYSRALLVLKECCFLRPKNVIVPLTAAKLCFEYLQKYEDGIMYAEKALEAGDDHPMASRAYVALGIGYSLKAVEMKLKADRQTLHTKALNAFLKAHALDPNDYLSLFHLALQLAILRQVEDAIKYTRLALKYYSEHIHSLHLLVLLLSAQKNYEEAMQLIKAALEEYPDNLSLLLTKAKLEEIVYCPEEALNTCKRMLKIWKDFQEIDSDEKSLSLILHPMKVSEATDRSTFDKKSQANLLLTELTDRETGSMRAESIAASRMEKNLSEVASSGNGLIQSQPEAQRTWRLLNQIWLYLADLYLSLDKMEEAEACVSETATLFPLSHQVAYIRGRVYEHKQKYQEAKACYENAISINPSHTSSLQHLGMVLHELDNDKLAEKMLRDAVNMEPTSHQCWFYLGLVLESLGHSEGAADCHATALELELTSPVVPFTVIPRLMQ
ncbi:hypothetical protein ACJMK2_036393 [Sinanodonta woodiana]|uniref:Tetratricopeptide repeat protein 7 N-terminal domain-containing protein n=2 Tax=Sinanodonta woodiana TaxID=1069815 RepID=A0ABD3WH29_SINWO